MTKCERCGKEIFVIEPCTGCKRKLGRECEKSSKRLSTHERLMICKDCWGKIPRRQAYKRA